MLSSTNSSFGEWPHDFLCFSLTYYFVELYFIKRHVWRFKIFHKTVHKAWNLFKLSKQSSENSAENLDFQLSIDQTGIEQRLRHLETLGLFSYHFNRSSQSFNWSKMLNFEFSLRKFQNLNFHFNNFMKQYSPNLNNIITTYPCIYLYVQQFGLCLRG